MIAAALVFTAAVSDLLGLLPGRAARLIAQGVWLIAAIVAQITLLGLGWGVALAVVLVAGAWTLLAPRMLAAVIAFPVIVALALVLGWALPGTSETAVALGALVVPTTLLVGGLGVVAFLGHSANVVCRTVLSTARASDVGRPVETSGSKASAWVLASPRRTWMTLRLDEQAPPASTLKGGRIIGPLERLIMTALLLSGLQAVVAALMAAKGIVRFPEISADRGHGSKAEEFLVGSLVSWAIAGAGALLLVAWQNT